MNLKKWTSALTFCAVTFAATVGAAPAFATDTGVVGQTPNLEAAADAMAAATDQLHGGGNQPTPPDNGAGEEAGDDTEALGYDYVPLANPATIIDGQVYLPLRDTLGAMKDEALQVEWKAEKQSKMKLYNSKVSYEVYLTDNDTGVQIKKGGTTYAVKNDGGVTYLPLTFFQAIIQPANVGLSGNNILVLEAKNGTSVWNSGQSFWTGMNTYQSPAPEPEPPTEPEKPVDPPDINYPDVDDPDDGNNGNGGNSGNNGGNNGNNNPGGSIGSSVVPVKPVTGGNGLVADTLFWPTSVTYITSLYGYRIDPVGGIAGDFHLGVDIAGPTGTPIYAAQGGKVIRASWFSTYGNCIDIQHPSGLVTRYAHLSAYNVSVGDTVVQGQTIAAMGATGNVTGPHVHFETLINGQRVDPANYLNIDLVM